MIRVIDSGLGVSVQDRGRFGLRRFGVPVSGALDPLSLAAANLLLGNDEDAAGLEILMLGPTLTASDHPVGVALAGELGATIDGNPLPAWQGARLEPGSILKIKSGFGYLALSGGIASQPMLGSRSTYRRAGLGLLGDTLSCGPVAKLAASLPWQDADGPIRLLPGPQNDHFADPDSLVAAPYQVAADSDRMGLRLNGARLVHNDKGADILTDGVLPGVIQVPGDGQPILLLADAQTSGGYAKIATVIAADMARLGHCRAGDQIRFAWVGREQAKQALAEQQAAFTLWRRQIGRLPGQIDQAALYEGNLISGASAGEED
jgi:biotin-dependent carboxylase-like uncharacterized protein